MRLREGTTPEEGVVPQPTYVGTPEATVYPDRSAHVAYTVFVPFWCQGYAKEGCARMLRHLLEDHGARVVVAEMDTRNAASVSLAEALGFGRVGTTLGADHFKGSVSDEHRYELRVEELEATPSRLKVEKPLRNLYAPSCLEGKFLDVRSPRRRTTADARDEDRAASSVIV
jgi:hypothetical protein